MHGHSSCLFSLQNLFILGEAVAIKAIDMKGIRDSAAKEMLEFEI